MGNYKDIINHPHHVSKKYPQMSMEKRAAQFAPFAAVTGHKESVNEAARYTECEAELSDEKIQDLNKKLSILKSLSGKETEVTVTFFKEDLYKSGGQYIDIKGKVLKIEDLKQRIVMDDGTEISMKHIQDIQGSIFDRDY